MEPLRKAAEKAVHDLPGVTSVTAVLTAERAPQGTGGQGGGAEPAAQRPHGHSKPSTGPGGTMIPGIRSIVAVASGKGGRSDEHTSELQSLMRSSYAVFC